MFPRPALAFDGDAPARRRDGTYRAVVLLHGLRVQPVSAEAARRAEPSHWESPDSPAVRLLGRDSDVYAFHYAQTLPLDDVARLPALARSIRKLREAGYEEVVLLGFSVGGVIARHFVEDTPNSGVTKVIQVCSPNGGSEWSFLRPGARAVQSPFIRSIAKKERQRVSEARTQKSVPADVEFVCVVGAVNPIGDGVVSRSSQWPRDLRAQGIPASVLTIPHVGAMYSSRLLEHVADLVRRPLPRWTPDQVEQNLKKIVGPLDS